MAESTSASPGSSGSAAGGGTPSASQARGREVASSIRSSGVDIEQLADRVYRLMREDLKLQLRRAGQR